MDQCIPRFIGFLGLDGVEFFVIIHVVTEIREAGLPARIARGFPPGALASAKSVFEEVLVELLRIDVDPPVLPVDHHANKIGLRRRDIMAGDLIGQHGAQERGVRV